MEKLNKEILKNKEVIIFDLGNNDRVIICRR